MESTINKFHNDKRKTKPLMEEFDKQEASKMCEELM
jgi:hypothetical protein